ncbi:hypothetical protein GCM10029964_114110 [Kibdelosporangium lantanae]
MSAPTDPTKQPPTRHVGGLPPVITRFVHSSLGIWPTHSCHAPSTFAADPAGNRRENTASSGAGSVLKMNSVAIPKFPPPPPRSAQNRSVSVLLVAVTSRLSAVTMVTESSRSHVRPYFLDRTPIPPPRVSPATPTVGHEPAGRHRPALASAV